MTGTVQSGHGRAAPFTGEVPLIGREEELTGAAAALAESGCVIAGAAGVGKSRLAAEVALRLGAPIERVLATAAGTAIPFGAVSHLLLMPGDTTRRADIPAFIAVLRNRFPDEQATLLVDDAHLLDSASAALLLALSATETARLLLTVRTGEPMPDAVVSLWKERVLHRIDLQPLSRAETRTLLDAELQSHCHASVYSKVFALTEGNPLFISELLRDAVGSGSLACVDGRWCWTGKRTSMQRLRDLIGSRTRAVSAPARRALEVLALGAPLELDVFEALSGDEAIAELERSALASVGDARGRLEVDVMHPLYGEVVRAAIPVSVARGLRRELARAMTERGGLRPDEKVRVATWMLEAGEVDHDLFIEASNEALKATSGVPGSGWGPGDATIGIRLADAAGQDFAAALTGAAGRVASNRFDEAEALLSPYEAEASQAPVDVAASYLRTRVYALQWGATGTAAALALLERSKAWHDNINWRAVQASTCGWIFMYSALPDRCRRAVETFLGASDLDPRVRLDVLTVLGVAFTRLGLIDRCEALEPEIKDLTSRLHAEAWETGWAEFMVDGVARTEDARDVGAVAARLQEGRVEAQMHADESLAAALLLVEGRLALVRGHVLDAIERLEDSLDGLTYGDPRNGLGLAFTYLARAQAVRGDVQAAARSLQRAAELAHERPHNRWLAVEFGRAAAWVDVARGRVKAARERLLAVADGAGEDLMARGEATYGALRLGADPERCSANLETMARRAESELVRTYAEHAKAIKAEDPGAQLDVAIRFGDLGVDLFAAEAAARASRCFRNNGQHASARRAAAVSATHERRCQGAQTPALELRTELAVLTPREREAASLAARGLSNATIAEELVLSVRSVESYMLRVYRKLGISSRRELSEVLGSLDD